MWRDVTFRSTLPIDYDKCPPGEELAIYIADRLTQGGLSARVVENDEDFAWWIAPESELRMPWALLWDVGGEPTAWLLQTISSVSWIGRLLGRSDEEGGRIFTERLQAVLSDDPNFSDVRWHTGGWYDSRKKV